MNPSQTLIENDPLTAHMGGAYKPGPFGLERNWLGGGPCGGVFPFEGRRLVGGGVLFEIVERRGRDARAARAWVLVL